MHNTRDSFGSKFGAIAALAGSAVGLGNIWKFPYEVGNNGGDAFLLVYIFFTVAIGLPVMLSEFALGRYSGRNAFGTFDRLEPKTAWRYFGVLVLLAATMILSFYGTVAGWTLEYVFKSFTFSFHADTNVNLNSMFSDFITNPYKPVFWQIVFMALTGFIVLAGVKKGIERYTKLMMPLLFVLIVILGIRACTLDGAMEGIKFLFLPKFSELTSQGVLSALGQAFFSLSIGMGVLLTYASYIKKDENLTSISLQVICADTLIAVLAGIAIFPAVFAFNIAPDSGPGLVFLTLPQVFQSMAFGQLWAILFFLLLTMAALTSSISLLEVIVAFFVEEKHISRRKATVISTLIVTIFGILCTLSFGPLKEVHIGNLSIFGIFDYISSNILLPVGGILISIYVGWRFDRHLLETELTNNGELKLGLLKPLIFVLKYIAPLFILVILLHSLGLF